MAVQLTNKAYSIEYYDTASDYREDFIKGSFRTFLRGEVVTLAFNTQAPGMSPKPYLELRYATVSVPAGMTSAKLLYDQIIAWSIPSVTTTGVLHYAVEQGNVFVASDVVDLANVAVRDILLVTSEMDVHLYVDIQTETEADYKLYEGVTATDNGTEINLYNKNRDSANTPIATCFHTPTIAGGAEGTLLIHKHWGSGKAAGGEDQSLIVWLIKANTKYLIRITNYTTSNNHTSTVLHIYEH